MAKPLKRILLVEDEPDIRTIATMALEAVGGYEVIACASGAEALEAAPGADADLILLDVMMPGMDGPSTLRALRQLPATKSTPVIFITAKVQPSEVREYRALGSLDVICKPFVAMELPGDLRTIWERACALAAKAPT